MLPLATHLLWLIELYTNKMYWFVAANNYTGTSEAEADDRAK